jgi:hypothetical protein
LVISYKHLKLTFQHVDRATEEAVNIPAFLLKCPLATLLMSGLSWLRKALVLLLESEKSVKPKLENAENILAEHQASSQKLTYFHIFHALFQLFLGFNCIIFLLVTENCCSLFYNDR